MSLFMVDFDAVYSVFSEGIALSDGLDSSLFVVRWRHNFRKSAIKNCEKSKNRRKSLCAPLRIDSINILIKFNRSGLGRERRCSPIQKKFSARRNIAPTANVKLREGSPKLARNKHVCAHQKSYRK